MKWQWCTSRYTAATGHGATGKDVVPFPEINIEKRSVTYTE